MKHSTNQTGSKQAFLATALLSLATLALSGCGMTGAGTTGKTGSQPITSPVKRINGIVHGGQQPVSGATITLYAASTSAYGGNSTSKLTSPVASDANGNFGITGLYDCTGDPQVYLVATGGNPGLGAGMTNPQLAMMVALGSCVQLQSTSFVSINELTTVAAVWALSPFMTGIANVGTSSTNVTGLKNAFASASRLVNPSSGALAATANITTPGAELNTLADILATCINSTGGLAGPTTSCGKLFNASDTTASDTIGAALAIAKNPGANTSTLLDQAAPGSPFQPTLSAAPNDWTVAITYTGGGLNTPQAIAIDSLGNAWIANANNDTTSANVVTEISGSNGTFLSGANGYNPGNLNAASFLAIDTGNNVWIGNCGSACSGTGAASSLVELQANGSLVTSTSAGGLSSAYAVAVDSLNNVWAANTLSSKLSKFKGSDASALSTNGISGGGIASPVSIAGDKNGAMWSVSPTKNTISSVSSTGVINTFSGSGLNFPYAIAVDHAGNLWVANHGNNSVSEFTSAGAPIGSGYTVGGVAKPEALALDGAGNVWFANPNNTISALTNAGAALSPSTGFTTTDFFYPNGIAVDAAGNVWITNCGTYCTGTGNNPGSVTQLVGAATPVVTPIAAGAANNTLATKP